MTKSPASLPRVVESWTDITDIDRMRSILAFIKERYGNSECESEMGQGLTLRLWDNRDRSYTVEIAS